MKYRIYIIISILILFCSNQDIFSFGKNKVNREQFEWDIIKTVHFDIYFPSGMTKLAALAAEISEEGYVHIANSLNHELTEVIPIIIYPSHIAFQQTNILQQIIGEGTGGFTESLKNRVVIPFTGSHQQFRHVLTHEMVHAFQYNMLFYDTSGTVISRFSAGGMPLWIMEGMAEYLSAGYDETADMVMRDILYNEKYATLMDLTRLHVRSGYLLYKEGQAFFYFLVKKYGKEKIGELLRDIRDLGDFDDAIHVCTGKTLEELNLEWVHYYKKRYFPIVKGKNFDEEEGRQMTYHQKTYSSFNVCPAISPDGKRIAYLTNKDIYSNISVITIGKKKEKEIKTVIEGSTSSKFEGMHLLSNYLTWSKDGKRLVFVAQSYGRDVIFIINPDNGDIQKEIVLPFRSIKDPALSNDSSKVVFIGQTNLTNDIYVYDIHRGTLKKITGDSFTERYPKLSSDNSFIIYSTNWNKDSDYGRDVYNIYKIDLKEMKRKLVVKSPGKDLQADLAVDDNNIIYISNRSGIYNAYRYDMKTKKGGRMTNVLCGIFYPRWFPDGERIAFVAYQNLGYDIFIKDIKDLKLDETDEVDTEHMSIDFPPPYFPMNELVFNPYRPLFSNDMVMLAIAGTTYGVAGIVRVGLSDYMGNHRIVGTANFFRYKGDMVSNWDLNYSYLKHRIDYGVGFFRQENPFGILSLSTINELVHNVYWDTLNMDHYGVYGFLKYPFSRFFRCNLKATSSRYEVDYSEISERPDIYANLNQLSFSLNYDNILWGYLGPLDGVRGRIEVEQAFNLTGQDYSFTNIGCDIRKYFLVSKRYVFALQGSAGKIVGPHSEYFKYYLGGFSTLRGHTIFAYNGSNIFLGKAEFRFIFVEGIKFGWPLFFRTMPIGAVFFTDFGSAWDDEYRFTDKETGEFADFKMDWGFGFRITLFPVVFKLDYAWPYHKEYIGDRKILFSIGLVYWD